MIGTFRNGEVSIYDASGAQAQSWVDNDHEGASSLGARSYCALTCFNQHNQPFYEAAFASCSCD